MRKLKLLGALLAMMALLVSVTVAPAMADHWYFYDDEWGECGWFVGYPYGWYYDCHDDEGDDGSEEPLEQSSAASS